ncbi:IucA/IucC family protein [Enterovibrio baiacu]|uniref:IucA/IucC family protein n=1 Tax=Enterovibrio baiacu TaxID=2491023 RepID=UPI001012F180|nr:IucA/IucC family protein [Enterovibrio baiacu]MBE1277751.1 short-chain isoprenyl diphosphate synthase [Enterovibrio baiacu]
MPLPNCEQLPPEARVIKQLLEALLFEKLVEPSASSSADEFFWLMGQREYSVEGHIGAFGRYRLAIYSLKINGRSVDIRSEWLTIIDDLPTTANIKKALTEEFLQTVQLSRWNMQHLPKRLSRRLSRYSALEHQLDEGHPYHPSFKARTGFTESDHRSFGPETGNTFNLYWLAVRHSHFKQTLPVEQTNFWLNELGHAQWSRLSGALNAHEGTWEDYGLLPIHPWQWQQLKEGWLAKYLATKAIIFLGIGSDKYAATQSVRTLLNKDASLHPNIKLPMNMVNTSSHRNLATHSVCLAPLVSQWLENTLIGDAELEGVSILNEYAGARFADDSLDVRTSPELGQLAVIFRESVELHLKAGEEAVPFNAIMMVENDGLPFITGWVERYGLDAWLAQLIEVTVTPIWHLLVKHGIGIEPHGQNMVLVHRDGWPERIIVRDFHESVEYNAAFIRDAKAVPNFAAIEPSLIDAPLDDYYAMSSIELLRELVMDTLFIYNLADVSHLISTFYPLPEHEFWRRVSRKLDDYEKSHPELAERLSLLGYRAPDILTESLMTRKLKASSAECHHLIPNPLSI